MNTEIEFYDFLKKTPNINLGAFENNYPYILQSTRNGLYIERDKSSIVYYTYRNKETIVIVNSLGVNHKELVLDLAKKMYKSGKNIILKNIEIKDLLWWEENGFTKTKQPWSKYSSMDDNSFPQYNVHSETVTTLDFKEDIQSQIKHFKRTRNIETSAFNVDFNPVAKNMLLDFAKYSEQKGNDYENEVYEAHKFFFDDNIIHKIKLQHIENNELIGYSFLTPVDNIVFYNMIICKYERNIMKYLVYESMKTILNQNNNIKLFGMQGSENIGQDYLKKRLNPYEAIQKTHLIYGNK